MSSMHRFRLSIFQDLSCLILITVVSLLFFSFILCHPVHAEHKTTIAYIGFSTDKPFWIKLGKAISEEASHVDVTLIDLTPPTPDIALQIKLLDHAINKGIDGIILGANRPLALSNSLLRAKRKNIPVVAIDTKIDHPAILSFVATDNPKGAILAGNYIVEKTGGKGSVLVLGGTLNHPNGEARRNGVTQRAEAAGMKVIFRRADWEDEKAFIATKEELEKENEISAIFACWDPGIDTASHVVRKMGLEQELILVGFDGLERTLGFIRKGEVTATIAQDIEKMANVSVTTLLQILSGRSYPDVNLIPPFLIDQNNLKPSR